MTVADRLGVHLYVAMVLVLAYLTAGAIASYSSESGMYGKVLVAFFVFLSVSNLYRMAFALTKEIVRKRKDGDE